MIIFFYYLFAWNLRALCVTIVRFNFNILNGYAILGKDIFRIIKFKDNLHKTLVSKDDNKKIEFNPYEQ